MKVIGTVNLPPPAPPRPTPYRRFGHLEMRGIIEGTLGGNIIAGNIIGGIIIGIIGGIIRGNNWGVWLYLDNLAIVYRLLMSRN